MTTITNTKFPEVILIEPKVYADHRGSFFESYNEQDFARALGKEIKFIQDNHSISHKNVLRGLHYQHRHPQGKLIRVLAGEIFDVAVDMRRSSPTFGQWTGHILSAENKKQIWIPEGFAHGYLTLSPMSEILYKVTSRYVPDDEKVMIWNDKTLGINWPCTVEPILSEKDKNATNFDVSDCYD